MGLTTQKVWYPAVSADEGTSMTLNAGEKPFVHKPPCGYASLSDLIEDRTKVGPHTQGCWTCKGECKTWSAAGSCSAYKNPNDRFEVYRALGMVDGGLDNFALCNNGQDGDCSVN